MTDVNNMSVLELIQLVADNNLDGMAKEMANAGMNVTGDPQDMVRTVYDAYQRGEDISFLGDVTYNQGATGPSGPLALGRGFFAGTTFNSVLGTLGGVAAAVFGGQQQQPVVVQQDNSGFMGLQRTTLIALGVVGLIILLLVAYMIFKKK